MGSIIALDASKVKNCLLEHVSKQREKHFKSAFHKKKRKGAAGCLQNKKTGKNREKSVKKGRSGRFNT